MWSGVGHPGPLSLVVPTPPQSPATPATRSAPTQYCDASLNAGIGFTVHTCAQASGSYTTAFCVEQPQFLAPVDPAESCTAIAAQAHTGPCKGIMGHHKCHMHVPCLTDVLSLLG